jgi:hypothetical protein
MRFRATIARIGVGAVLGLAPQVPALAADPEASVPVEVGGAADEDACAGSGKVAVRSLNVRAAPSLRARVVDQLQFDAMVIRCEQSGEWIGIVYDLDGGDCGTGTPIAARRPYSGRCRSGWVYARFIAPYAG